MTERVGSWLPDRDLVFPEDDAFGVDQLIDDLASQLVDAQPPFAVSLSGSWGVGKSTVAKEIVKRLRARDVRCIFLDAWTLDVRHLRRHLVVEVGAALQTSDRRADPEPQTRKDVALGIDTAAAQIVEQFAAKVELRTPAEIVSAVRSSLLSLIVVAGLVIGLVGAGLVWVDVRGFLFTIAGVLALGWLTTYVLRITTPSRSRAATAEDVVLASTFADTVSRKPSRLRLPWRSDKPTQIVIVVDNLDRLSGQDALDALSQIRALLDVPHSRCVFVIPIDRDKLEDHLRRGLGGQTAAADYLEKFFGLDLALTQPEPVDLRRWAQKKTKQVVANVDDTDVARLADVVVSAARRSPRAITRLINGAATRHRVVATLGQQLDLAQAALIESVLFLAPDLLTKLEANPREFTGLRDDLSQQPRAAQLMAVADLLGSTEVTEGQGGDAEQQDGTHWPEAVVDFHRFLLRSRAIPLSWEQVRVTLALRENRLWVGVSDWDTFQQPMDDGEVAAFASALHDRNDERAAILSQATEALIETAGAAVQIAHGLNVLTPHLNPLPAKGPDLRHAALESFEYDELGFPLLSVEAASFLLDAEPKESARLRETLTKAIEATKAPEGVGLAQAAVLVKPRLNSEQIDRIRKAMAGWPAPMLRPIFDEVGVGFVEGPVGAAMIERLVGWTPGASDHEEPIIVADSLMEAQRNGWGDQAGIDRLAAQISQHATAIAGDPDAHPAAEKLVGVVGGGEASAQLDSLAQVLAQDFAPQQAPFMRWAWRLPLTLSGLSTLVSRFDQWVQGAALERIGDVLDEHRTRLVESSSTYRAVLLNRWQTTGDAMAARLAMAEDPAGGEALVGAWKGIAGGSSIQRALEAFEILSEVGTKEDLLLLTNALPVAVPSWPSDLSGIAELTTWMIGHQVTRDPLVQGLAAKAQAIRTASELDQMIVALDPTLDSFGSNQRQTIADGLTGSLERVGVQSPEAVSAAVKRASTAAPRENVTVALIDASLDLERTLQTLEEVRTVLNRSYRVFEALVARAAREGEEAHAASDLEHAKRWRRPPKSQPSEVEANLTAVETRFPNLSDLVGDLRR